LIFPNSQMVDFDAQRYAHQLCEVHDGH
jgi:hypothetical protein